ncbi:AraC family transcriptional regulator [Paenibacillus filicis]|uniref:AraC family transcriptional regulator n=1 Tax=Paenibacillus filicis TaxID=669464 RepID=A0ABU9DWR9_9BACL
MPFQELVTMIPMLDQVSTSSHSQTLDSSGENHILIMVLRGHVTITPKDQAPVVISQGYACHPSSGPFAIQVPRTKEAEYVIITYGVFPEHSPWTLSGPLRTLSEVKIIYMLDELTRTLQDIHPDTEEEQAAQSFRKRFILERILFIFMYETHMTQDKKNTFASMEDTLSYIQEHYMLKLTLPMLAQRAGMSAGHFTVLFKKHTGTTMIHYLRSIRIEKAKQLFLQTHLPAKEIAQQTGFSDYFHFSRIFKKEVGCSPTEYLKGISEI